MLCVCVVVMCSVACVTLLACVCVVVHADVSLCVCAMFELLVLRFFFLALFCCVPCV